MGVLLPLALATLFAASPAAAQQSSTSSSPPATSGEDTTTLADAPAAADGGTTSRPNPCAPPTEPAGSWLDRFNRTLNTTVCQSAVWFDSFFGDSRAVGEYQTTGGLVSTEMYYTTYDGFTPRFSFRAHFTLPNLGNKFDAFIGRQTRDEYLTDTAERSNSGNPYLGLDEEEQMLVGLGWNPRRGDGDRFRVSAGVQLGFPSNPYLQARYRYLHRIGDNSLFRWRQTVFWELQDQLGTTTHLDLERRLGDSLFLRWSNSGTVSGGAQGIDWWSNLTLFQSLGPRRALAYTVWDSGETGRQVPVTEYGLRLVYRQRVARDWLFVDAGPILSWERKRLDEPRETSWGAMVGVEMAFGSWR